jgi:methylglutaconyl-CoA hydratase
MTAVRVEIARGVMTVTLADLANKNALGAELVAGLGDALARANADDAVRVVVITNEGNTFCAGANLKEQSGARPASAQGTARGGLDGVLGAIMRSPTPVVGRIAGHVVGGGNGLAAALDVAIAADDVKFGFTEVRLGVIPAIISVVCLPKMRRGEAMEAFLRGNRFSAARAAELGLISRAVPRDGLDAAVEEVVEDLRQGGPRALGLAKRLVYEVPAMSEAEAFAYTTKLSGELFRGAEAAEGMRAFLEKRPAAWSKSEDGPK